MTTGEKIRVARKERGLTQRQLADKCGMADSAIRKYESGRINPKLDTIQRIAAALGIHVLDLMGVGKELDQYAYQITDVKLQQEATQREKDEAIKRITKLFEGKGWRDLYDGLSDADKKAFWQIMSDYEAEVEQVAQDYDELDQWGKQAVRAVIAVEKERMRGTEGSKDTPTPEPPPESP